MIPNLLIIAGTGNKSGKTSMACRLIEQFCSMGIVSVKITPHFHETTPGLVPVAEKKGFSVYRETNKELSKDTSRMLRAGAADVFFAKVADNNLQAAYDEIMKHIKQGTPVVCESPALAHYVEPGLLIIMNSPDKYNQKDISNLLSLPHVEFSLGMLSGGSTLPILFRDGKWISLQNGE